MKNIDYENGNTLYILVNSDNIAFKYTQSYYEYTGYLKKAKDAGLTFSQEITCNGTISTTYFFKK